MESSASRHNPRATSSKDKHVTVTRHNSYSELKWPSDHLPLDRPTSPTPSEEEQHDDSFLFANLPPVLQPLTTALLIVDVQPEYWSDCEAVRKDFDEFPDRLASTIHTARLAGVAQILWVRADYRYSHSPWLKQFARIHGKNKKNFRTEVPCDLESKHFQWEKFATPLPNETVLPKTSWSSTSNTALMDILQASNIDTVLVCGLITSVCVQHSAFGVFEAGYRTLLVQDACADRGRARHEAALALYADYMYTTVTSDQLPQLFVANDAASAQVHTNSPVGKDAKTTMTTVTSFTSLASAVTTTTTSHEEEREEENLLVAPSTTAAY